jgi:hypothetical protein
MGIVKEADRGQIAGINGIAYYDHTAFYPGPFPFSMNLWKCDLERWEYETD